MTTVQQSSTTMHSSVGQEAFTDTLLQRTSLNGADVSLVQTPYQSGYPINLILPNPNINQITQAKLITCFNKTMDASNGLHHPLALILPQSWISYLNSITTPQRATSKQQSKSSTISKPRSTLALNFTAAAPTPSNLSSSFPSPQPPPSPSLSNLSTSTRLTIELGEGIIPRFLWVLYRYSLRHRTSEYFTHTFRGVCRLQQGSFWTPTGFYKYEKKRG